MKEKIAKYLWEIYSEGELANGSPDLREFWGEAEDILKKIKQEIEKVENELIFIKTVPSMGDDLLKWHYDKGFKDCRQAILKILT